MTVEELKQICTENGMTPVELEAIFHPWGGGLRELCEKGFLCYKVQEKKAFKICPNYEPMEHIPPCILLAGFDQLMLGYQKKESIYLTNEHIRGIFNLAGIVMPPVLINGNVVGRWRKKNSKLTFEMFQKINEVDKKKIVSDIELLFNDIKKMDWVYL